jgi:hypothetical protein
MPGVPPFHSVNEKFKQAADRIYHDNDACPLGRFIPNSARLPGNGGHRRCQDCERLSRNGQ